MTDANSPLQVLVRDRLVRALVVIALLLLIVMEGVQLYRSVIEARTATLAMHKVAAEKASAEVRARADFINDLNACTAVFTDVQALTLADFMAMTSADRKRFYERCHKPTRQDCPADEIYVEALGRCGKKL